MIYIPKFYMRDATSFCLSVPRCNLWLDPGLGKTGIVLASIDILQLAGSNKVPVLVVAPLRVARSVWTNEVEKWETFKDLSVSMIVGSEKQRIAALEQDALIYTINYENLPWLVDRLRRRWPFKHIICDESTKLKGFRLRRSTLRADALSRASKFTARWNNLTGTPAPNGLLDLWGQNWFVDAGARLGKSFEVYKGRWFKEDKYKHEITAKPFAEDDIMARLQDVTLSMRAEDCLPGLKKPYVNDIRVDLPPRAMKLYKQFERDMLLEIKGMAVLNAETAADLSLKCLQLASGAYYADEERKQWETVHQAKVEALDSLLTELAGNPLLCTYHFRHDLNRLLKAFPDGKHLKTTLDEEHWNEGRFPIAFIHAQSAGHGLNLQYGGHHICYFSQWWDLEQYQQVLERIGPVRQLQSGFKRKVGVHHLVGRGTLDEAVLERRAGKASVQDMLRKQVELQRL